MIANEKNIQIAETAFGLFAHYGVAKTSMTEIAAASKISRQTLYKAFESKEDLIFEALNHYGEKTRANIEAHCARVTDFGARLDGLFEHMGAIPFAAMKTLPHLDEILEIGETLSPERLAQIRRNYTSAAGVVLAPYEKELSHAGIDVVQLCGLMKSLFTQIKRDAKSPEQLRALFEPLRAMLVFCVARATS